ncbi:MAG: outer membrane beta-barrel protein [Verrucomicrobia bacterium]|nr:outer membrane beta-barrel protein [Cytophagales bacterium]
MKIYTLLLFCLFSMSVFAQFERKVSFTAFTGSFIPVGKSTDADGIPTVFPNFKPGVQLGVGLQYNFNGRLSAGIELATYLAFQWTDPNPFAQPDSVAILIDIPQYTSYFSINSFGLGARYKILPDSKFSPYIFAHINLNVYAGSVAPRQSEINLQASSNAPNVIRSQAAIVRFNARTVDAATAIGYCGGLGFEFSLSETFAVFLQGGYFQMQTRNNAILRDATNFINIQGGVRFNIFKLKSIY